MRIAVPVPPPTEEELAAHFDAAARLLGLSAAAEWRGAIVANLVVIQSAAALLQSFPLDDELEPAPTFLP